MFALQNSKITEQFICKYIKQILTVPSWLTKTSPFLHMRFVSYVSFIVMLTTSMYCLPNVSSFIRTTKEKMLLDIFDCCCWYFDNKLIYYLNFPLSDHVCTNSFLKFNGTVLGKSKRDERNQQCAFGWFNNECSVKCKQNIFQMIYWMIRLVYEGFHETNKNIWE